MSDNDKKRLGLAEGFIIILLIGIVTLLFWVSSLAKRIDELIYMRQTMDNVESKIEDMEGSIEDNEARIDEVISTLETNDIE